MQETWVWSLIWEDLTCREAIKPVHHNHWACALELDVTTTEARAPQLGSSPHYPQLEKSLGSNEDPAQPKNK